MEDSGLCRKCRKRSIIQDPFTGTLVCNSCGLEHDGTNFVSPSEGYGENQRSFGPSVNRPTYFSAVINGRRIHIKGEYNYKDQKKAHAKKALDGISSVLGLSEARVRDVKEMVESITDGEWGLGRWFSVLIGACVCVVARQKKLPFTMTKIAAASNCDVDELGRMYIKVRKFLDLQLPGVDIISSFNHAVQTLDILSDISKEKKDNLIKHGHLLLQYSVKWYLTTGRHPLPMVAAVLAFVANVYKVEVGLAQISEVLCARVSTCVQRYKELQYMEMKSKSKPLEGKDASHLPADLRTLGSHTADVESVCSKALDMLQERTNARHYVLARHPKGELQFSNVASTSNHENNELQIFGNDDIMKFKLSEECLCRTYFDFLNRSPSVKPLIQNLEGQVKKRKTNAIQSSLECRFDRYANTSMGLKERFPINAILESDVGSNILPPSFLANMHASMRRREKINAAKLRICEIMKPMSSFTSESQNGVTIDLDDDDGNYPSQCMPFKKKRKCGCEGNNIDWEDNIIEILLLHQVSEEEIVKGHYRSLLDRYVFDFDSDISDKEFRSYTRSKDEVAKLLSNRLSMIRKQ
ncbi:hypothetical protein AMTRI_Chr02g258460 [Amborella trichopoda]